MIYETYATVLDFAGDVEKYLILICRVLFVLEAWPLFSSWMVLVLSCWMIVSQPIFFNTESLICCSTNSCIHSTKFMASLTPTNYASVELFVSIFCFIDIDIRAPWPNDNTAPVWLLMSLCIIAKDASTDHRSCPVPSHPNTRGMKTVNRIPVIRYFRDTRYIFTSKKH
jgi:hypothetical protein